MSHFRRAAPYLVLAVLIGACGFGGGSTGDEEIPDWLEVEPPEELAPITFINAPPIGARELRATVTTATGLDGVTPGSECHVWILSDQGQCQANVECGEHVLWGRGGGSYCPCTESGDDLSGGEEMVTSQDGDGAFSIDTAAGTLVVRDSEDGELGAFEIHATL